MRARYRALVALVLLAGLGGLAVHADVTGDDRWPYPGPEALESDYDRYVDQRTFVTGSVAAVDGTEMTVEADTPNSVLRLRVTGVAAPVEPGGVVQVYGTIRPDRTIAAERVEVVNSSFGAELYKYGASAVGALGFLMLFFRYWRPDTDTWTLEARDG
ncbi:hypothetical protein [Haloarcula salina]|uniref:Uncharacterized protein n=1 Tax=Haloarcula salina TaxID=1429914 RepID=A0AA41FXI6_9EURY|nr:hypothetical protein [Haloarcula salina]MBV0900426.1 hypothetical protein [Haloarcula salina]